MAKVVRETKIDKTKERSWQHPSEEAMPTFSLNREGRVREETKNPVHIRKTSPHHTLLKHMQNLTKAFIIIYDIINQQAPLIKVQP